MKVTFYKYDSRYDGFRCQWETVDRVGYLTKKEVMEMADLRHPILSKREYYENLSTNIRGEKLKEFQLMGSTYLMVVQPFERPPKNI